MLTPQILTIVAGISSFMGLASLFAYLYFVLQFRRAEYSVQGLLEGEKLFNAEQVVKILAQFKDDAARLAALRTLTKYDASKAAALLSRVKDNIDVKQLTQITSKHYRQVASGFAIFFLLLAALALAYSQTLPRKSDGTEIKPTYGPTPIEPNGTYRINVAWVNLRHCDAAVCDVRVHLKAWNSKTKTVLVDSSAVVPSWSEGRDEPPSDNERKLGIKPVSMRHPDLERGEITFLGKDKVSLQLGCDDRQGNPIFGTTRELDAHDLHSVFSIFAECGWVSLELGLSINRLDSTIELQSRSTTQQQTPSKTTTPSSHPEPEPIQSRVDTPKLKPGNKPDQAKEPKRPKPEGDSETTRRPVLEAGRPAKPFAVLIRLGWGDAEEGALPQIQEPKGFICLKPERKNDDYLGILYLITCEKKVAQSGNAIFQIKATLGKVNVLSIYGFEGEPGRLAYRGWLQKGQADEFQVHWELH